MYKQFQDIIPDLKHINRFKKKKYHKKIKSSESRSFQKKIEIYETCYHEHYCTDSTRVLPTNLERIDRKFGGGVSKITLKSSCYRFRNRFSRQCGKQDRERRIIPAQIIRWWESRNWRNTYISWRGSKLTDSERNYFNGRGDGRSTVRPTYRQSNRGILPNPLN